MDLLNEGVQQLGSFTEAAGLRIGRQVFDPQGPWGGHTFPLLEELAGIGHVSPYLTRQLAGIISQLEHVSNEGNGLATELVSKASNRCKVPSALQKLE